ncbi:DUF1415 domain-containing protein [Idiomarina abyssalis]|uniref:DUF1415 domain-containing protein n=1 Tax=Idiomarina abyssalis TaxID=86102 RepID=A0A8I1KGG2_9GAMM|nr:DUF1415 domain-containing protein [Idiomarina abyssalis]MBJ7267858.1 DUF1415 domain-containing protein [Idiomarina abyssalis]MBJ7273734.1 DUF1415 domain-containing protein [Idiomarina abyssalis]MBJ7314640.1 DUF1415 domain-containing protein [Idiomarina abyssalis]
MTTDTAKIIEQTRHWVQQLIVKYNICPFARREVERKSIRYMTAAQREPQAVLQQLLDEVNHLDATPETETTLLILPSGFEGFYDFLTLVDIADALLVEEGYEGVYQLAHFHPDYCFDGEPQDDPANYTNRAPYPTLHLLREASIEEALKSYDDPESIPERNIEFARRKGSEFFKAILSE